MSILQMTLVWELDLDHPAQAVLLAMADHANDEGAHCYPSVARLCWKTGYSESAVRRIMRDLRQTGLIEPVANEAGGRGKPVEYRLHTEKGRKKTPFVPGGETSGSGKGSHPEEETLSSETETLSYETENPVTAMTPEPSLEPSLEPSGEPSVGTVVDFIDTGDGHTASISSAEVDGDGLQDSPPPASAAAEKFSPPGYWSVISALDGYVRRDHTRFVRILEATCADHGVSPVEVVQAFADFYSANRFVYGWSDPAAALRRTLVRQIANLRPQGRPPPRRTPHERRIAAEKEIPIRTIEQV